MQEQKESKKRNHDYSEEKVLFPDDKVKKKVRNTLHAKDSGEPFTDEEVEFFRYEGRLVDIWFAGAGYYCGHVAKVMKKQIGVEFFNNDPSLRLLPRRGEIRKCLHDPQIKEIS